MTERVMNGILADVMRRSGIRPWTAQAIAEGKWVPNEPVELEEEQPANAE